MNIYIFFIYAYQEIFNTKNTCIHFCEFSCEAPGPRLAHPGTLPQVHRGKHATELFSRTKYLPKVATLQKHGVLTGTESVWKI